MQFTKNTYICFLEVREFEFEFRYSKKRYRLFFGWMHSFGVSQVFCFIALHNYEII